MTQFSRQLFRKVRQSGRSAPPPRRGTSPRLGEGLELERRALQAIVALTANASPMILRRIDPMNQPHQVRNAVVRPITLAGYVGEDKNFTPVLSFRVVDEYGRDQPSGTPAPQPASPAKPIPPGT